MCLVDQEANSLPSNKRPQAPEGPSRCYFKRELHKSLLLRGLYAFLPELC